MNRRAIRIEFLLFAGLLLFLGRDPVQAERPASPFGVKASIQKTNDEVVARFAFEFPPDHVIYAERLHFLNGQGDELTPVNMAAPVTAVDKVTGHEKQLFNQAFTADIRLNMTLPAELVVKFQGCSNVACYFPEKRLFSVNGQSEISENVPPAPPGLDASSSASGEEWKDFKVVARQTGYVSSGKFLAFLEKAANGQTDADSDALGAFRNASLLTTIVLMLLGGIGLNLTPCVLPLIPINLAIIGAGKSARSRGQGFAQGAIYGAGMAVTYGILGLAVVVTGAKFGALNSKIWFNVVITLLFLVLALAMFDKIPLDFSRFDTGLSGKLSGLNSRSLISFFMGGTAALLAGACVAPVVISVLLLSANLYAKGAFMGILLPFVLGIGMALPWPFAGASLSFLPKPGRWMVWVKHGFGVLIVLFAGYYAQIAYGLFQSQRASTSLAAAPGTASPVASADDSLRLALEKARAEAKLVFIDFGASWCKNCLAMEETVFNRPDVQKRLEQFVTLKYPAERPNESPAREILDQFGVIGLPTYVVLAPGKELSSIKPISSQPTNETHL